MSNTNRAIYFILRSIGSARFALVIVFVLIALSLAGVLLPQHGRATDDQMHIWQIENPRTAKIFAPVGFLHVFQSWPFLITIALLAVNTLACTLKRLFYFDRALFSDRSQSLKTVGFALLHLGIIAILTGAMVSSAARFTGRIVLTEGQTFSDQKNQYVSIAKGPFSRDRQSEMQAKLTTISIDSEEGDSPIGISAEMEFAEKSNQKSESAVIKFNRPVKRNGLNFVLNEIGFSPKLKIQKEDDKRILVDSFISLKTFKEGKTRVYRDFLPMPFFENTVYVTLLPSHSYISGRLITGGDKPDSPLIIIESKDESGEVITRKELPLGKSITIDGYIFTFGDLRRWAGFVVATDPGYAIIWLASWLALAAILLRYFPDMLQWFEEKN